MSDWEFGSDREMQEAARRSRRPPLTAGRVGEIVGAMVGLSVAAALCVLHFWLMSEFNPRAYVGIGAAALFGGAWAGKKCFSAFGRRPNDPERPAR